MLVIVLCKLTTKEITYTQQRKEEGIKVAHYGIQPDQPNTKKGSSGGIEDQKSSRTFRQQLHGISKSFLISNH